MTLLELLNVNRLIDAKLATHGVVNLLLDTPSWRPRDDILH